MELALYGNSDERSKRRRLMLHRLIVSMTVAGLVCGYAAVLYALMYMISLIDHSYFHSLAM
jgi:hypothetical protein